MQIIDFEAKHIPEAQKLVRKNYKEARQAVPALPEISDFPSLDDFAKNNLGVAAFDGNRFIGFLCWYPPRERAFNSNARGLFSPVHAHGAVKENRGRIYQRLYEAAAQKWVAQGVGYHAIAFYAHEYEAHEAMFMTGFGMRCMDAIRDLSVIPCAGPKHLVYELAKDSDLLQVQTLHQMLLNHLGESPTFMKFTPAQMAAKVNESMTSGRRHFVAKEGDAVVAFLELSEEAETFVSDSPNTLNICGAYCLPAYRGQDVFPELINYVMNQIEQEGVERLGVDFESFNLAASGFWLKHFTAYTKSVVRRIDECALE